MAESLTGMLRIRSGQVQIRRLDGAQWRDLVPLNTLLTLGGQTPVDPGPTDPPPTGGGDGQDALMYAMAFTPDNRDLVADGFDAPPVFNYNHPVLQGGALVVNAGENAAVLRRRDVPLNFRVRITFSGNGLLQLFTRGNADSTGKMYASVQDDNGELKAQFDPTGVKPPAPLPLDDAGHYVLDVAASGTLWQVNGSSFDHSTRNGFTVEERDTWNILLLTPGISVYSYEIYSLGGELEGEPPVAATSDFKLFTTSNKPTQAIAPVDDGWYGSSVMGYTRDRDGNDFLAFSNGPPVRADRGLGGRYGTIVLSAMIPDFRVLIINGDGSAYLTVHENGAIGMNGGTMANFVPDEFLQIDLSASELVIQGRDGEVYRGPNPFPDNGPEKFSMGLFADAAQAFISVDVIPPTA